MLFDESLVDGFHRFVPVCIERRGVAGRFPEMVSETDRIAEGVNFPFAFVQFLFHVREVAFPFAAGRTFVETVCIRVDVDAPGLAVDYAGKHGLYFRIVVSKLDVRENLGG